VFGGAVWVIQARANRNIDAKLGRVPYKQAYAPEVVYELGPVQYNERPADQAVNAGSQLAQVNQPRYAPG
jgi:hypothetical protein